MEHFFSPNSRRDLPSDSHQSRIIGGDADEDHTQIVGGDKVKLLRGIYPPTPRVLAPLALLPRFIHSMHWLWFRDLHLLQMSLRASLCMLKKSTTTNYFPNSAQTFCIL